jgi:hypothetical protein
MNISDKIDLLDKNAKLRNEVLWKRSEDSLALVKNPRLVFFIKSGLTFAIISIIIGCGLIAREFIKGDYPIYGKERIGAICQDGWESFSTGSGTCSHHGGVDYWKYPLVNYHYADPNPYYITIAIAIAFLILVSIIYKAFRLRLLALICETFYWLATFLFLLSYIFYSLLKFPFLLVRLLYKIMQLFINNKSK